MRLLCSAQPVHARADLSRSFVQALQTGQFSLTIKLGPETATQLDMIPPTEPLVNMTIVYPSDGQCRA